MKMDLVVIEECGIQAIRIRLGLFGRPILEVQKSRLRKWLVGSSAEGQREEAALPTKWRKVNKGDALEVAKYLEAIQRKADVGQS